MGEESSTEGLSQLLRATPFPGVAVGVLGRGKGGILPIILISINQVAEVAELVDAPDLGSGAARCESSSLSFRTILRNPALFAGFFFF